MISSLSVVGAWALVCAVGYFWASSQEKESNG